MYAGIQFVDAVVKQTYQQQILHQLLLQSEKFCDYYTFQQDGAPSHTSTKKYLHENWRITIIRFGKFSNKMCSEQLKERLQIVWNDFEQVSINGTIIYRVSSNIWTKDISSWDWSGVNNGLSGIRNGIELYSLMKRKI